MTTTRQRPAIRSLRRGMILSASALLTAAFLCACSGLKTPFESAPERTEINERCGDLEFSYHPAFGASLTYQGIPVFSGSHLWVVTPKWAERYYGSSDHRVLVSRATIEPYEGGKKITLYHSRPPEDDCPFDGVETFILLPDNTYQTELVFTFRKDAPAMFEWKIGELNPTLFAGRPYTLRDDKGERASVIPVEAPYEDIERSLVARGFASLEIASRLGRLELLSDVDSRIAFLDYRKNKWATPNRQIFWLGVLENDIVPHQQKRCTLTIQFPKDGQPEARRVDARILGSPLVATDRARVPRWEQDYILPTPKNLRFTDQAMPLSNATRIYIGPDPDPTIEKAVGFLLKDLKENYHLTPEVVRGAVASDPPPRNAIVLGEAGRFPLAKTLCEQAGVKLPAHEEGYALSVTDGLACIAAPTGRGVFYGVTSLVQLIRVSERGVFLRGAAIEDYPALDFRGIHCLTGKDAGDEIARAVRELMARFKINSLVWETEYLIWDSQPDIAHPDYGMTKSEARKVLEVADANLVEIIPLVQSLGHSEWIFVNGRNLDLAEDPEAPHHYCPTNPDTYTFIESVYQEAVDFFRPRYFHIGHDEIQLPGRFPYRSKSSGKTAGELILEDIERHHAWFTERDIRIMIWGDMFLWRDEALDACNAPSIEEAKARRAALDRDIIITDWHYAPGEPDQYTSIKIWKDEGFDVIGAPWDNANNIRNLARACAEHEVMGLLQTTWAGFNFKITDNEEAWHQYAAYLLAAEHAWSGENTPTDQLPYLPREKFLDVWFGKKPLLNTKAGHFFDLRPAVNRRLDDDAAGTGWLGYGPARDFSTLPTGQQTFGETTFLVQPDAHGRAAVLLHGRFNPPGTYPAAIELACGGETFSELHFLLNAAFRTLDNSPAGNIRVVYTDGTEANMALLYGKQVFASEDNRLGRDSRQAWTGTSRAGEPIRAWNVVWSNPHPEKPIGKVVLESSGGEAALALFALTGVQ